MAENLLDTAEKETKQYIVVRIGGEKFGIDIGFIDNIVRMMKITRVPKAQKYFKGIINLRGEIVPVMSARLKMGLDDDVFTNELMTLIFLFLLPILLPWLNLLSNLKLFCTFGNVHSH